MSKLKKLEYQVAGGLITKKTKALEKIAQTKKDLGAKAPIVEIVLLVMAVILIALLRTPLGNMINTLVNTAGNKANNWS